MICVVFKIIDLKIDNSRNSFQYKFYHPEKVDIICTIWQNIHNFGLQFIKIHL